MKESDSANSLHQNHLRPPPPPQQQQQSNNHSRRGHHRYHPRFIQQQQYFPNRDTLNYHLPNPSPLPVYGFSNHQNPIILDQTLIYGYPPPPPPPPYTFTVAPPHYPYTDFVNDDYYYTTRPPRTNHESRNIGSSSVVDASSDWDQELTNDPLSNIIARISINESNEEGTALLDEFMELAFPEEFGDQSNENLFSEEFILESLTTKKYYQPPEGQVDGEICVVCQCEYEDGELLGILGCGHQYHVNCIKTWLMRKNVCPVCKRAAIQFNPNESWNL